ncbi:hypothetical protein [Corynebacterium liangguodongii]|uniref:Uncharacterized protein n=1 Tax=Corynebacterium liangguodongii TaxID=2079535 RepID=A0A2S0WDV0_9CORY|nr:hypothetical protein [Corynebacterium liangguodongii]AWB83941.1 hypothetical protein C3E79_05150 [Corynebacterium liangguodongii]PWB99080.1 hypothetical protein DF219_08800 [Corynebacterium liangguodongii]
MRRALTAALVALAALASQPPEAAHAATGPAEYILPQRWNDDYKPGSHCATPGEGGIYVNASRRWFDQTDAASVANRNATPVPVTHKVTQARSSTLQISATVQPKGEIERYIATAYGLNYVRVQQWSVGETVGPYELGANRQGKLVWGFMMLDTDNQNVRCSEDQVWEAEGARYAATVPESRYSELREDDAPVFG